MIMFLSVSLYSLPIIRILQRINEQYEMKIHAYLWKQVFLWFYKLLNLILKGKMDSTKKKKIKINCNRMVTKLYPKSFEILICLFHYY